MDEMVKIVPYNPAWPAWFDNETAAIKLLFDSARLIAIEHYGSTAVPGLAAKPTIGILVGMQSLPLSPTERRSLEQCGYQMYKKLEGRTYWRKSGGQSFTLAITTFESEAWFDHLAVRDYLRQYPESAHAYAAVKYEAIKQGNVTADSYRQFKNEFLDNLFCSAKQWRNSRHS